MSNIIFMARLTDAGDFAAARRAEQLLQAHGFSVGTTQRGSPRGILFGAYDIQKWRNLDERDRAGLHGVLDGDRSSHAQIEIWDPAPLNAVVALADALEGQLNTVLIKRPPLFSTYAVNGGPSVITVNIRQQDRLCAEAEMRVRASRRLGQVVQGDACSEPYHAPVQTLPRSHR